MDLKKNDSFSLFRQKPIILGKFLLSSPIIASIGLKSPLSPLARMWAKYLESLESNESASLGESPKCLISASRNNSSKESAAETSRLGSISLIAI